MSQLDIRAYFHDDTSSVSYLIIDRAHKVGALIDPVLDFDLQSGRVWTHSADVILADAADLGVTLAYTIETHIHADHLSASAYINAASGARSLASAATPKTQAVFEGIYDMACPPNSFDQWLEDGETLPLGAHTLTALATPGHTLSCMTLLVGDCAFVGDTLFMPDYGSPRCDFPGGDAATLHRSIQKLYDLPGETRLFTAHDYKAPGRDNYAWESTVAQQKEKNVHVRADTSLEAFVTMRSARDATLAVPKLMLAAVQVNICGGHLPAARDNKTRYLRVPLALDNPNVPGLAS